MEKSADCRARIGWLIPHLDSITEPLLARLLPESIFFHAVRMWRAGPVTIESLQAMAHDELDGALRRLPVEFLDLVVYHCTSGTVVVRPEDLIERIERSTLLPAITTSLSVVEALKELKVKRISLVTPYVREINQAEKKFLEERGFEVVKLGGQESQSQQVPPNEIARWAMEADSSEVEAIFISCTGLHSVECTETLEHELGKPIITSTAATIWYALKRLDALVAIPGCGRLLG